jgi:hypothetical protein
MTAPRLLAATVAAFCPGLATANALTFDFHPSDDPRATVLCTVQLQDTHLVAVEIEGTGAAPQAALRWPATKLEADLLLQALGALLAQDIASVDDPNLARPPDPPYASIRWFARTNDGLVSGLYLQPGLALPHPLDRVVAELLFGGPCAALAAG